MLTEKEAREKWCPMVRIARRENTDFGGTGTEVVVGGCNTDALGGIRVPASCRCIASDCAMWRWGADYVLDPGSPDYVQVRADFGYCGLARRPEVMG